MKKLLLLVLFLPLSVYSWATMYQTNFPSSENPLSESGNWINGQVSGIDWSNCRSTPGFAFGNQSLSGSPYNDSTCVLQGNWGANQTVQATVAVKATDSSSFEEVELRLRTTITAHSITGYEINCSVKSGNPYLQIVRWNGPLGSWTQLDGRGVGCSNGTVLKATISGSTITVYRNGSMVMSLNDSTFKTGSPGMGFFLQSGAATTEANYGFSTFSADDGSVTGTGSTDASAPVPPTNLRASAASSTQINLTWSASTSTGVAGYRVSRCKGAGCLNFAAVASVSGLSYSSTGLSPGTSYSYYVETVDTSGNVSAPSAAVSAVTPYTRCY